MADWAENTLVGGENSMAMGEVFRFDGKLLPVGAYRGERSLGSLDIFTLLCGAAGRSYARRLLPC